MTESVTIDSVTYPNLTTAQVKLKLTHLTLSDIRDTATQHRLSDAEALYYLYCKENGTEYNLPEKEETRERGIRKDLVNSKTHYFEWFENHYNQKFNNFRQLLSFLKDECNNSLFKTPISLYATDIIKYLIEGGLEPLTLKKEDVNIFEYDNVYFRDSREFFVYHQIFSFVFYFNLYRTRGNVKEAIDISKQYTIPDGEVEFDGYVFDNCFELLKSWGVPMHILQRTMSLNLPFEKALIYTHLAYVVIKENEVRYNGIPQTLTKLRNYTFKIWGIKLDEDLAQYILDGNTPMTVSDFEKYIHDLFTRLTAERK